MPRTPKKKLKSNLITKRIESPQELEDFIREADSVKFLTSQSGWAIIGRDITLYKNEIANRLAYLNPATKEYTMRRFFI
jgi:hypothetical protein